MVFIFPTALLSPFLPRFFRNVFSVTAVLHFFSCHRYPPRKQPMQLSRMTRGMNCHSPFVYPKLFAGEGKRKRIIISVFISLGSYLKYVKGIL